MLICESYYSEAELTIYTLTCHKHYGLTVRLLAEVLHESVLSIWQSDQCR